MNFDGKVTGGNGATQRTKDIRPPFSISSTPSLPIITRDQLTQHSGSPAIREIKSKSNFTEFKLANGLRVILKQNNSPAISASLLVATGSNDDPLDKQGLAHFLEHMTIQHNSEFNSYLSHVVHRNGGSLNAMTHRNSTSYLLELPKDKLDLALRIFRSYLSPLTFSDGDVSSEISIISKEIKKRNSKQGIRLEQCFSDTLYGADHSEARPIIGSVESVCNISKTDLLESHEKRYLPNKAALVISGDFMKEDFKQKVVRRLGALTPGADLERQEPASIQGLNGLGAVIEDSSLNPTLFTAIKLPETTGTKDEQVLAIISRALSLRLIDKFVHKRTSANTINSINSYDTTFKGFYSFNLGLLEGVDIELMKIEIEKELKSIKENGIEAAELSKIIHSLKINSIYKSDSHGSGLNEIASCVNDGKDWSQVVDKVDSFSSITNDDILSYLERFEAWDKPFYIHSTGRGDCAVDLVKDAAVVNQSMPREMINKYDPERIRALSGGYSAMDLELNGLQKFRSGDIEVFLKEDQNIPLVFSNISFKNGLLSVPKNLEHGLTLMQSLLNEGTFNEESGRTYTKEELLAKLDELGIKLQLEFDADASNVKFSVLSEHLDESITLLDEIFNHSKLMKASDPETLAELEQELEISKKRLINHLIQEEKDPHLSTYNELSRLLFPSNHLLYENDLERKIEEIESLTLDDMRDLYRKVFSSSASAASFVGDVNKNKACEIVSIFDLSKNEQTMLDNISDYETSLAIERTKPVYRIIDSESTQPEAIIKFGNSVDIKEKDDDFVAALLANLILGVNSSSRLFRELRVKQGLAYGLDSSFLSSLTQPGLFSLQLGCDPNHVNDALKSVLDLVKTFVDVGVTEDELELAKSRLKTRAAMSHLSNLSNTRDTLASLQLKGRDEQYINTYSQMIDSVSLEKVNAAIRRLVKPDSFSMVISKPNSVNLDDVLKDRGYQEQI